MKVLQNLQPHDVFKYFEELSQIPRGSGNEKQVSDYLVNFGKELGLEAIQDEALNVIIKKPGTKGYENSPTVIIQGHMDMVCEKNKDTEHDFEKDPLKLRIEGDYIYATGTTLGADNGIAVAYGMAVLASKDLAHPPIELLVTSDEEAGMGGAMALKKEHISGKILLNIDSEEEGFLQVSCAGGVRTNVALDIEWEDANDTLKALDIRVRGLKGGHSGMEINKERGNSNKLMGRVLNAIADNVEFNLASLNGGSKNNAIPRECDAVILVKPSQVDVVKEIVAHFDGIFKKELEVQDENVRLEIEDIALPKKMFSKETTDKAVMLLHLIPNGVDTMSRVIKDLVQSSTNLGVVTTTENSVEYDSATRSSVATLKEEIVLRTRNISNLIGANFSTHADYPAWEYNPNSKLREVCQKVMKAQTGKEAEVIAMHAGLECGLFSETLGKDIDMISFGPNMYDVHTPNEHVSISSVKNVWDFLVQVLIELK
ncbi:aminoacyl-histidine dipeptidase [Clostridium cavendishii]|nr:aminoacyl-histidine dipeptidase [Clostridium cavendishii]